MKLRDYQKECVDVINGLPDGARSVVVLATGLGKTVVGANIHFKKRMLWISHRDELVRQPEKYFTEQGFTFGIEKADEHENGEDVVSASIQSISRDLRLKKFARDEFDVVVCDEAHHAAAASYRKVLTYFKPHILIGLTATPSRGDGVRLTDVFDDICFVRDIRWGIQNKYLSPIRCQRVYASFDVSKVKRLGGDLALSDLERKMKHSDDDIVVTKAYLETCLPEKRQTLIYCPTVSVCRRVYSTLQAALPEDKKESVAILSDETDTDERHRILDKYKAKEINCIINCMILTEGTDLPETSCIINNRPSANPSLYQQIVGRGTRLAEGKDYCLVIDVIGKNNKMQGLCTAPTLFGLDPDLIPHKVLRDMEKKDLLEACDEIAAERASAAKSLELVREMVDIFTQERIALIQEHAKDGLSEVANAYAEKLKEETPEQFGDIVVTRFPSAQHRYHIQPTYHGDIWLSEPDVLGRTIMDVKIPADEMRGNGVDFLSDPVPMDQAIAFLQDFLQYMVPSWHSTCWSKNARKKMADDPATERQQERVEHDYASYKMNAHGLSKLQASDLISLKLDIAKGQKTSQQIDASIQDRAKTRRGRILEQWMEKQKAARQSEALADKKRRETYRTSYSRLQTAAQEIKTKTLEAETLARSMVGKTMAISIPMKYDYFSRINSPTPKQVSFLHSLVSTCDKKRICFDTSTDVKLDMWHTSFLIDYLLRISNNIHVPSGLQYRFMLSEFLDEIAMIPRKCPRQIQCRYRIEVAGYSFSNDGNNLPLALPAPTMSSGSNASAEALLAGA